MAAGLATLKELKKQDYQALAERTKGLAEELQDILTGKGLSIYLACLGSLFTLYFCSGPVTDFASAKASDSKQYASFYQQMRRAGVYLAPSGFEAAFTSFAHTDEDFHMTIQAAKTVQF
jgi:glutamate-1-semialdehyde 2,1-aminomutase